MYTIELDSYPKKVAVPSQLSAEREFKEWLTANNYLQIADADGLKWDVHLAIDERPAETRKSTQITITMTLKSRLSRETLINDGTCDPKRDERLLTLMGDGEIALRMSPIVLKSLTKDDARRVLAEKIQELRKFLSQKSMHELKRVTLGKWLEKRSLFGGYSLNPA